MATRKSKNRRTHERPAERLTGALNRLKRKLEQGPFEGSPVIANPADAERMSDVLADFVSPFADAAGTPGEYKTLLTLGVTAWNVALFPPEQRSSVLESILAEVSGVSAGLDQDVREIISQMIARKDADFADNRRAIIAFTFEARPGGYQLTVGSTVKELGQEATLLLHPK